MIGNRLRESRTSVRSRKRTPRFPPNLVAISSRPGSPGPSRSAATGLELDSGWLRSLLAIGWGIGHPGPTPRSHTPPERWGQSAVQMGTVSYKTSFRPRPVGGTQNAEHRTQHRHFRTPEPRNPRLPLLRLSYETSVYQSTGPPSDESVTNCSVSQMPKTIGPPHCGGGPTALKSKPAGGRLDQTSGERRKAQQTGST